MISIPQMRATFYYFFKASVILGLTHLGAFAQEKVSIEEGHPLFGKMEAFFVKTYYQLKYAEGEWDTPDGKVTVAGRVYSYDYRMNKGAEAPGKDAVIRNYENAVKQLGGQLMASADKNSKTFRSFKLDHKEKEIWIYVGIGAYNVKGEHGLYIVEKGALPQEITADGSYVPGSVPEPSYTRVEDSEGTVEHPLFNNRLNGIFLRSSEIAEFEKHTFSISREEKYEIEGKKHSMNYRLMPGAPFPGVHGILRNYQNAVEQIGGKTLLFSAENLRGRAIFKLIQGETAIWVEVGVDNVNKRYSLVVVESQALEQLITANADYMAENLKNTGRVAVYGILFDTGKSIIKAGSEEPIAQIAQLLEKNETLDLYIVGHTDMQGELNSNLQLAKDRANAVVQWLVDKHKVKRERLVAQGVGPLAPVASNESVAGKRLNRRVELVKR
ncbi:MAG: OmpA family protein [Bacteroidota bacterium]